MFSHPNFDKKFYLQMETSNVALNSELYQMNEDQENRTIAFAKTTCFKSERN